MRSPILRKIIGRYLRSVHQKASDHLAWIAFSALLLYSWAGWNSFFLLNAGVISTNLPTAAELSNAFVFPKAVPLFSDHSDIPCGKIDTKQGHYNNWTADVSVCICRSCKHATPVRIHNEVRYWTRGNKGRMVCNNALLGFMKITAHPGIALPSSFVRFYSYVQHKLSSSVLSV